MTAEAPDERLFSFGAETFRPPDDRPTAFFLGKIGTNELVEMPPLDYMVAPGGAVGVPVIELEKLVRNVEPDSILWLRAQPVAEPSVEPMPDASTGLFSLLDGRISVQIDSREVTVNDKCVEMTKKEFDLLLLFIQHPRIVLDRARILYECWGHDYVGNGKTLDVHVRRLRYKLGEHSWIIKTIRSLGYKLDDRQPVRRDEPGR